MKFTDEDFEDFFEDGRPETNIIVVFAAIAILLTLIGWCFLL
jgi:hypothetical protein